MHDRQLSWPLKPNESLSSPECVAIYSDVGLGSMSRKYHRLYRRHLIKSAFVDKPRPALLNSWEGLYFDYDEDRIEKLASAAADLGAKLFVLDDGWFGVKHPRVKDMAGLGDWKANPDRFPNGLKSIIDKVNKLKPAGTQDKLQFGLWIEPEMVNPKSELYENHPDWVLSAPGYPSQQARNQLVLNLGLPEVQDYIINCISALLEDRGSPITYIKWDNNRPIHETPSPQSYHKYMLGMYRVFETLTSRYPDVLWEGCAGGGGRFDPGVLQYFAQIWTSDNMDPLDRIKIQFGTSLVYPMSTMGAHVGAIPSHVTKRTQSLKFRAHVALMGGSFGLELDPEKITPEERAQIPELIALSEKINPIVIKGDLWRLRMPEDSEQAPAALVISEDGSEAVLFAFHLISTVSHESPYVRLQGLDPAAKYKLDGGNPVSGATLMNGGIKFEFDGDYDSKIVLLEKA
jgi:alpha-galactosidase